MNRLELRKLLTTTLSVAFLGAGLAGCSISHISDDRSSPLVIQEQGSFAVGGSGITNPGTFDSIYAALHTSRFQT